MTVKVKPLKVSEEEIADWDKAAKLAKVGGKESFNNWARDVLNKAAKRILRNGK